MRNAIAISLIVIACSALAQAPQPRRVVVGGGPQIPPDWPKPDVRAGLTPEQTLDAVAGFAQKLVDTDHFSGVMLLAKDGKPVLSRAWGMANESEKNSLDTKFNIGSINKVFTKRAIEQLVAAGKVSLDDTIRKHLPDFPLAAADKITIRQLLDHRSGLGDTFGAKYDAAPPSKLRELSDFVPLFVSEPLQFEPGTSQRYSNAGYIVLGLIIEKESGEKYRDYVQKHIFAPAGMSSSGFWAVDEKVPHRATGYTLRGDDGPLTKRVANTRSLPGRPSSAGGAYATAGDLLRYFQWTKQNGVGVGGGAPGLNAAVEVDQPWTLVVMSNYDPPSAEALAMGSMQIVRGTKDEPQAMRRAPSGPAKTEMNAPIAVPLGKSEHLVTVEAKLNGKGPFHFVLDSGSGGMLRISPAVMETLKLEQVGEALSGDPSGKNMQLRPIVRVDSVEIGGAKFGGVDATVGARPGPVQPDGVIGLPLFAGLTVAIDYPKNELRLSREPLAANGEHVVSYSTERGGVPQIDLDAAGVKLNADVDTGSPALLNAPPSANLPFTGEARVVGHARTANNEFDIKAAELNGDVRVAGWSQSHPMVDVVDFFPMANLGSRFLRQYVVTFDTLNKRMSLTK
jgi:CubicO group peptidase (beta-lactamase class C family)